MPPFKIGDKVAIAGFHVKMVVASKPDPIGDVRCIWHTKDEILEDHRIPEALLVPFAQSSKNL
jgi:hypothetical protein